jgi:hypothetical protein
MKSSINPFQNDNNLEYVKKLEQLHEKYIESLSDDLREVLNDYTQDYYKPVNEYIKYGSVTTGQKDSIEIRSMINKLHHIINNAPKIEIPIVVYKGVRFDDLPKTLQNQLSNIQIGDTFNMFKLGFNSTTFTMNVTYDFTSAPEDSSGNFLPSCCTFALYLPVGIKGLYIGKTSTAPWEDEFLLGSNPEFRFFQLPNESFPIIYNNPQWSMRPQKVYRLACNDAKSI